MSLLRAGIRGLTSSLHAESGAVGASRANPAAVNAETVAGPWKMTVLQVQTGSDAAAAVTAASQFNVAPADGSAYVVVKIRVQNASNRDYDIEPDDFGVTGSSGVLSRFSQQIPPDPALHGTVKTGETLEGSIVAEVPVDETNLLLVYDSLSITGNWSDCVFALADGAAMADAGKAAAAKNNAGTKVDNAAQIGDEIVTDEWAVKLIETASGATDVGNLFPSSDYRTTALLGTGSDDGATWLALHVQVKNVRAGGAASFLPATAFLLVTSDGKPVNDVTLLTPPDPDVSGTYYPGGSRDGWVLFEQPNTYPDSIVRFLPFVTDGDARYFDFGGGGSAQPTPPAATVASGAKVTVSEDVVNLRSEPSTSGEIVVELKKGDELTVTGEPVAGDNYQWYPVTVDSTGQTGYIASNFVSPA
jgi:hypothetical protein